jgi:hypothetical protein
LTLKNEDAPNRAMKINRSLLVAAALSLAATLTSFAANAHIGVWKLNEAKSKFSPGAAKNHTVTYAEARGDKIKLTVDGVDKDGKPIHWTWIGKFDGKPYKIKGSAVGDMAMYKPIDDHANELTIMKDGKAVVTGMIRVSKDGKSRVVTTTMIGADGKKHTDKAYYTRG